MRHVHYLVFVAQRSAACVAQLTLKVFGREQNIKFEAMASLYGAG